MLLLIFYLNLNYADDEPKQKRKIVEKKRKILEVIKLHPLKINKDKTKYFLKKQTGRRRKNTQF